MRKEKNKGDERQRGVVGEEKELKRKERSLRFYKPTQNKD